MHFQFLIEDQSSAVLVDILMRRIVAAHSGVTFDCKAFKGIGAIPKKKTIKEIKTGKLLNDLPAFLRGFNKSLRNIRSAIVVVIDNDDRDPESFRDMLNQVAKSNHIDVDYTFCIAVEEIEAWFLGDKQALVEAYPSARLSKMQSYVQDSICGTWEILADVVYPGGSEKLKKNTYVEIGKCKCEWASRIGSHLDMGRNISPSFNYFISEINKRLV